MTDHNGQPLPGAHIQGMFHRLVRLLPHPLFPACRSHCTPHAHTPTPPVFYFYFPAL
jgi:hypothetical protein